MLLAARSLDEVAQDESTTGDLWRSTASTVVAACRELLCAVRRDPVQSSSSEFSDAGQPDGSPSSASAADGGAAPQAIRSKKAWPRRQSRRKAHADEQNTVTLVPAVRLAAFPSSRCPLPSTEQHTPGPVLHSGSVFWGTVCAVANTLLQSGIGVTVAHSNLQAAPVGRSGLKLQWPASADDLVAMEAGRLLQAWAPRAAMSSSLQAHVTAQQDMMQWSKVTLLLDNADMSGQSKQSGPAQLASLVHHVIGQGPGQLGASGLRHLHEFRFEPFNPAKPWGPGQAWATLTDGRGVFMVVLVKDLGFIRASTKRPAQTARNEFKRREKKRGAVDAALRAAGTLESQHLGSDAVPCAIVFAAVCCSHAGRAADMPPNALCGGGQSVARLPWILLFNRDERGHCYALT